MKLFTALALAALSPIVLAQNGPPPPQRGGVGRQSVSSGRSTATTPQTVATVESETIRILRLKSVQIDLALTNAEIRELSNIATTLGKTNATEEMAYTTVSQALSSAQASRLQQLLIQDLGYNALALSDVRDRLSLSDSQNTQIASLVATLETAKSLLSSSLDVTAATKARSMLMTKAGTELAKVLTSDQDAKLRSLAGRSLSNS